MTGRIPEEKIEQIRTAADVVEIIAGYVPLKKRGRNFMGLCPFHSEKTPSFSVSPEKQIYHCFGCGKGGNAFTFLMEYEKITFIEAVNSLAERYGIPLPKYERKEDARTERMLYANNVAPGFFQKNLKKEKYRARIDEYLRKKRNLTVETIEKFRIGLAGDDWQGLINYAKRKDLTVNELAEAGLAIRSEKSGEYFDRFRMRLMIPIFNLSGKIVGFGGRALKKGERAKYMNSPETPVYNKSFILYGMNFSKSAIRESGSVILVEGYFDYLSLHQAGIENVVAVSGTSFTPQQAKLLARFAQKAYLFFDADSAGYNAALRSVENFFNAGIEPLIVSPPPGKDPDSFVQEGGPEEVYKLLEESLSYITFRFYKVDFNALTMREKEQVAREIQSLANKIDDPLKREIFISSATEELGLPQSAFKTKGSGTERDRREPEPSRNFNMIEAELLSLIISQPQLIETVWKDIAPEDLQGPGHASLYNKMIESYRREGLINPHQLLDQMADESERHTLTSITTQELGDLDPAGLIYEFKKAILNHKRTVRIAALKQQLARAEKAGNRDEAIKLGNEIKYLLEKRA
jgi:DNA primase